MAAAHLTSVRDPAGLRPRDDVERALLQTRALLEETMTRRRERAARHQPVLTSEVAEAALPDAALRLHTQARTAVDVVLGGDRAHAARICAALAEAAEMTESGPVVRILLGPVAAGQGVVPAPSGGWAPWTRVARIPAVEAVLADGVKALIRTDPGTGRRGTVVRAVPVVDAFGSLFDRMWQHAVPLDGESDPGDRLRARFVTEIIRRLGEGRTDEAVARELNVSVRTYRRHVAEVMEILGATSRFQAGVRAAELGLCTFTADRAVSA